MPAGLVCKRGLAGSRRANVFGLRRGQGIASFDFNISEYNQRKGSFVQKLGSGILEPWLSARIKSL